MVSVSKPDADGCPVAALPAGVAVYEVGGCVRDEMLHVPLHDRDWVVVGATAKIMQQAGFKQVGRDFPVFLHPQSHEEYALARTERNTAPGYHGFQVNAAPDVSLEEDLARRDLTINAIARCPSSGLISDPFHGRRDLQDKRLRHVTAAFDEDPLRVLRVARFHARLYGLGFVIDDATCQLMQQMVRRGDLDYLSRERVGQEVCRAMATPRPDVFIRDMIRLDAWASVFVGWSQPDETSLERLRAMADAGVDALVIWSVFQAAIADAVAMDWGWPRPWREWPERLRALAPVYRDWSQATAEQRWQWLKASGLLRMDQKNTDLWLAAMHWFGDAPVSTQQAVAEALLRLRAVRGGDVARKTGLHGRELGAALHQRQLALLQDD